MFHCDTLCAQNENILYDVCPIHRMHMLEIVVTIHLVVYHKEQKLEK